MIYSGWIKAVCAVLEYTVVNAASATPTGTIFDTVYPDAIDYAENRLQRDIDFLANIVTDSTATMTPNVRRQTLPTDVGVYVVVSEVRPINLAGAKLPLLDPVSRAFMDFAWPGDASPGANILPNCWCPDDGSHVLVGPAPDQAYGFEVVGTQRFVQMSAANPSNFLSLYLPELYVAASMVFFMGYQRDFGAQSDDPQTAMSWEKVYKDLLSAGQVEEARKRFADMFPSAAKPIGLGSQAAA